jgi:hypothetical protein
MVFHLLLLLLLLLSLLSSLYRVFTILYLKQTMFLDLVVIKPTGCTNFTNLFWHEILHVSKSSSVHHQEFIHCTLSNGISHTGS